MSRRAPLRAADGVSILALVVAAAAFVTWLERAAHVPGKLRAFDIYAHYFPNMLYGMETLRSGGRGFFWNASSNCGEPFFGMGSTAAVYPANAFFFWLEPGSALLALLAFNVSVAGVSAYGLARVLGLGTAAALGTGVAFAFGNANVDLVTWTPVVGSAYAWLPAVMLCGERLLQRPSVRRAVALGAVLLVALLGGYPQQLMLAYQLIALRLVWALATRESPRPGRAATMIAVGVALAPLLAAVVVVPGVEVALRSVRGRPLAEHELASAGFLTFEQFRRLLAMRSTVDNPFRLVPWMLFPAGVLRARTRRVGLFYLLVGLIYFDLAFGANGHLFSVYQGLPGTALFRDPARCMWIAALCLAVLVGLGIDALQAREPDPRSRMRDALLVGVPAAALAGFWLLSARRLLTVEWALAAGTLAGVLFTRWPRLRPVGAVALTAALALDLLVARPVPSRHLLPDWTVLRSDADVFAGIRRERTPQDRVYVVWDDLRDFSLMAKTPALFGLPSVTDYEPEISLRYAEFYVLMRSGRPMANLNDFYYVRSTSRFRRRLLDLTGARYIVSRAPPDDDGLPSWSLRRVHESGGVTLWVNPGALPRARWVPRLVVVRDPKLLLQRLADGPDDPRAAALVETPPASGFLGEPGAADTASVVFVRDDAEHIVLRVVAPRRGFLVVADQDFPGWHATVNGAPAEIVRADYVFRAVELPAGTSEVDFRYAPITVRIGAWVSGLTMVGLAAAAFGTLRLPVLTRPCQ